MLENKKVAILGSGNMAKALALGLKGKTTVTMINPVDTDTAKCFCDENGFTFGTLEDIKNNDAVVLAFKPQNLTEAGDMYSGYFTENQTVISILAGIQIEMLEKIAGEKVPVIRTMPNLALQVSKSATAYALGTYATEEDAKICEAIFSELGIVTKVDEKDIDTVTALSGSGPAYVYLLAECMTEAAIKLGMDKNSAEMLCKQTFIGTVKLWENSTETPEALRQRITSKKGTTEAAVNTMLDGDIKEIIASGLTAAKNRSSELAEEMKK